MSGSTLDPANIPVGTDRTLGRGHGTGALGPSDSSDSGSDVHGGAGLAPELDPALGRGSDDDVELGGVVADVYLDSDTDAAGTGERAGADGDNVAPDGADIDVDHIESIPLLDLGVEADFDAAAEGGKHHR
ncbi:hypothetical protein [Rugamonas rubra]|uniref:Uncharacterized protein n=1 Tax=Rugamonas rubra TaxID=758825 RepID=A0A1I4KX84_9BURK|nr:hypothetical protein [Rugamonas rubra]SFL83365.1 hypothetical protein SAMN02982985_01692 [Rugamonas rubra]